MELDSCGCIEITNHLLIELKRILQDERMSTCVRLCLGGLSDAVCYFQYLLIVTRHLRFKLNVDIFYYHRTILIFQELVLFFRYKGV